jgi:hypothetical protein
MTTTNRTANATGTQPYGIIHFFPEGTKAQYEAIMIAMNGKLGVIPQGQIFHAAGPAAGGWQIVAVQESKQSWDRFMSDIFVPLVTKGIPGGFTSPPSETTFDVSHVYQS